MRAFYNAPFAVVKPRGYFVPFGANYRLTHGAPKAFPNNADVRYHAYRRAYDQDGYGNDPRTDIIVRVSEVNVARSEKKYRCGSKCEYKGLSFHHVSSKAATVNNRSFMNCYYGYFSYFLSSQKPCLIYKLTQKSRWRKDILL